jgi:hypothetical protein
VWVEAPALETGAVIEALSCGRFYSSTGVRLDGIALENGRYEVTVGEEVDLERILWIGRWGEILEETHSRRSRLCLEGRRGPVRAKILSRDGGVAWTQPVFAD